jgi:hypothetical protein
MQASLNSKGNTKYMPNVYLFKNEFFMNKI